MPNSQPGSTALGSNLKNEWIDTLRAAGEHWLVYFLFLIGLQGIILTAALKLVEPLAANLSASTLYAIGVVISLVVSLVLITPPGAALVRRTGIP